MNRLFVLVGPSAAGKTLISNFIVNRDISRFYEILNKADLETQKLMIENLKKAKTLLYKKDFKKVITSTSRCPRENEFQGVDYYFYTTQEFEEKILENNFLEYVQNFGNYYGTSFTSIKESIEESHGIIVIDDDGARKLKETFKNQVVTIYLDVSIKTMEARMKGRNESLESYKARVENLKIINYKKEADYIIDANERIDLVILDIADIMN
ncbi:guanylate kinase [Clostridium ihumii]|uniref:guanylate kinase n=1 Tax=Clostridium ihumii TaxID=1470356 RepID=UPI003D3275F6